MGNPISICRLAAAAILALLVALSATDAFTATKPIRAQDGTIASKASPLAMIAEDSDRPPPAAPSRRSFLATVPAAAALLSLVSPPSLLGGARPLAALAADAESPSLEESLYLILRAREAAAQETRLIRSGRFKDVQRANVKLAVKFIANNYRLSDNFIAAAGTLSGNKRIRAGETGIAVVQNLYTILEYFDSSDVENIKVGATSMAGKEGIVLSGLDAARTGMDEYLSYFSEDLVNKVKSKIQDENALNVKEFDPNLGTILNPDPKL